MKGRVKESKLFGNLKTSGSLDIQQKKNIEMLDLITPTSSNQGSIELECFCDFRTTFKSAHINNRKWIGINHLEKAIQATIAKLESIDNEFLEFID